MKQKIFLWRFHLSSLLAKALRVNKNCQEKVCLPRLFTVLANDIKFGPMWKFSPLFSSIDMARCIMNSCHKVTRSIRNTALKLCAHCAKKFVRNAQNCEKINHGFPIVITYQLTDACARVIGQKQNCKHASVTVYTGLGTR